jgi:hypothetical protein
MATRLKRLQVRLNDDLLAQVRQLQERLSLTDSAVGSLLIAAGMRQFEQLGLVTPLDISVPSVGPVVADVQKERMKKSDAPKDDAPLGFRKPRAECEGFDEHEECAIAQWVPGSYMRGL